MGKKVVVIHTSLVTLNILNGLFKEIMPETKVMNIIDEDLLDTLNRNRGITPSIIKRVCQYAVLAEEAGADILLSQCSSVAEGVDCARKMVRIPFVKIDEAMAEKAVSLGCRIGVVATAAATLKPSTALLMEKAQLAGKTVSVTQYLADGALDILMKRNDRALHNKLVLELIGKASKENDVIVLAQGSMAVLEPELQNTEVPVLTSPRLSVLKLKTMLGL